MATFRYVIADVFTDAPLPDLIARTRKSNAVASLLAVPLQSSHHVVDVGDDTVGAGDEVVLFGPGRNGEPTAQDWADATGTISYEIVTRVGARVPRVYRGRVP